MLEAIYLSSKLKILVIFPWTIFQIPTDVPHPNNNTPIDLSKTEDVIIYILLPLIFAALFFIARRGRKKRENLKSHEDQNN